MTTIFTRSTWLMVAVTLAVLAAAGLGAGWLLERYETDHAFQVEATLIAEALELSEGDTVADISAGQGSWTVDMAERVGPSGHVYATGNDAEAVAVITSTVEAAGLGNVTVIETPTDALVLPPGCCDAVLVRVSYHHFADGSDAAGRVRQALKPGGVLAVIDRDQDTPEYAGGHDIEQERLVDEVTRSGLELARVIDDWSGNAYCAIFRRAPTDFRHELR